MLFVPAVLVGALAGLMIAGTAAPRFTSTAYLQIDEPTARAADALMSSEPLLDRVLAKIPVPGNTVEARRRRLDGERTISVARNEIARVSKLFKLDVTDSNPVGARATNIAFIEAWIEASRPNPAKRDRLEAAIKRAEEEIRTTAVAIERLQSAAHPDLSAENSLQGNPATPLASLLARRDHAFESLNGLKTELDGISREAVLLGEPTLPEEPLGPHRGRAAATGAVAGLVLVLLFLLFRSTRR